MTNNLNVRHLQKTDIPENWEINNPILERGEIGYDLQNKNFKIGDGQNRWKNLEYIIKEGSPVQILSGKTLSELLSTYPLGLSVCAVSVTGDWPTSGILITSRAATNGMQILVSESLCYIRYGNISLWSILHQIITSSAIVTEIRDLITSTDTNIPSEKAVRVALNKFGDPTNLVNWDHVVTYINNNVENTSNDKIPTEKAVRLAIDETKVPIEGFIFNANLIRILR